MDLWETDRLTDGLTDAHIHVVMVTAPVGPGQWCPSSRLGRPDGRALVHYPLPMALPVLV